MHACLDLWYLPFSEVACLYAQDTLVVCRLLMMLYVVDQYCLIDTSSPWLMCTCLKWCRSADAHTPHLLCACLGYVIWRWPMLACHDRCLPIDAHTSRVIRYGLCYWSCHWKTTFATCAQAMSDACKPWPMSPSWYTHTTFDVSMPWPIPLDIARNHLPI